jgi:Protein of unknown function (DUF3237)
VRHALSALQATTKSRIVQIRRPLSHALSLVVAALLGACASLSGTPSTSAKVISPSPLWDCGMPEGIPRPEDGVLVLEAEVKLDAIYNVGKTPFGLRQATVTQAGTLAGSKIQAAILPGGLDFQLALPNGVIEVEQILVLRTGDNKYVLMRNAGTGPNASDLRMVYDFEASTTGEFAWLNTGKYVGRRVIDANAKTMHFSVYEVSGATAVDAKRLRIAKPAGVAPQPWDYRHADPGEKHGETIVTEVVSLGGFQQLQAGKRGGRNVIPITGGVVSGMINGKVLFGGADYQTTGVGGPAIDARYLWQTTEGDVIIVRNTTNPVVGLVPTFEARVDSKYAWLNSGKYLSSNPGPGAGGVGISMYKSK